MALTTEEEAKLRTIITAYDNGQAINELPEADASVQDKVIEVYDVKTGQSEQMRVKDAVDMSNSPYFARIWDEGNGSPKAVTWTGNVEYGRHIEDILGLGNYLIKNDHSRRKLDKTTSYRFANGEVAKLDGSMGHVQWAWGKVFYLSMWRQGKLFGLGYSDRPIPGRMNYRIPVGSVSMSGHAAMDRQTNTLVSFFNEDPRYRGGDNQSSYDGTYKTLLGRAVTSITAEAARTAARKNGVGWMSSSMRHSTVIKCLFEITFGTRDAQAPYNPELDKDGLRQGGLGMGVTNWEWGAWSTHNGNRPFLPMDVGADKGDFLGVINYEVKNAEGGTVYTAPIPSFFGLKNLHGYLWRLPDDEFVRVNADTSTTHLVAPSVYGSWTIGVEEGMVALSTSPTKCDSYIMQVSYDHLENFPTRVGASSSTGHCDKFWNTSGATSGFRLLLRGCSADHGVNSGPSDVYVSVAVSSSSVHIGALLCEVTEDWPLDPVFAEVA